MGRTEAGKNERPGRSTAPLVDSLDRRVEDDDAELVVASAWPGAVGGDGEHDDGWRRKEPRLDLGLGFPRAGKERAGEGKRGSRGRRGPLIRGGNAAMATVLGAAATGGTQLGARSLQKKMTKTLF